MAAVYIIGKFSKFPYICRFKIKHEGNIKKNPKN